MMGGLIIGFLALSPIIGFGILPYLHVYTLKQATDHIVLGTIGLLQIVLSLALIWYYLSRNPELRILGPYISPKNENGKIVANTEHLRQIQGRQDSMIEPNSRGWGWKKRWEVECRQMPSELDFLFDIANVGLTGITLHGYTYGLVTKKKLKVHEIVPTYSDPNGGAESAQDGSSIPTSKQSSNKRVYLEAQEIRSYTFSFPWDTTQKLETEQYAFRIDVYVATLEPKLKKQFKLKIEKKHDNTAVITWTR